MIKADDLYTLLFRTYVHDLLATPPILPDDLRKWNPKAEPAPSTSFYTVNGDRFKLSPIQNGVGEGFFASQARGFGRYSGSFYYKTTIVDGAQYMVQVRQYNVTNNSFISLFDSAGHKLAEVNDDGNIILGGNRIDLLKAACEALCKVEKEPLPLPATLLTDASTAPVSVCK